MVKFRKLFYNLKQVCFNKRRLFDFDNFCRQVLQIQEAWQIGYIDIFAILRLIIHVEIQNSWYIQHLFGCKLCINILIHCHCTLWVYVLKHVVQHSLLQMLSDVSALHLLSSLPVSKLIVFFTIKHILHNELWN